MHDIAPALDCEDAEAQRVEGPCLHGSPDLGQSRDPEGGVFVVCEGKAQVSCSRIFLGVAFWEAVLGFHLSLHHSHMYTHRHTQSRC